MNQEPMFELAIATLKRRWKVLVLLCLLGYPVAVVVLRYIEFPYTAQLRMFALPQASQNILEGSAAALLGGGGGAMERSAVLAGQEALIRSNRVFAAVQAVDPDLRFEKEPTSVKFEAAGKFIGKMQEFIFGSEYVQTRQRWKNKGFATFKQRVGIDVDIDSASISIKYKHPDPYVAITAVRTAGEALQQINLDISKNQAGKKASFLAEKISNWKSENEKTSDAITAFVRQNKVSNDPRSSEPRFKGYSEANYMVTEARLDISQREAIIPEIKRVSARLQEEIKHGFMNDRDGRLKNLTAELRQYEQAISKIKDTSSGKVSLAVKRQIGLVRAKISSEFTSGDGKMDVSSLQTLLATNEASLLEQESALRAARKQLEFGTLQVKKFDQELSVLPELNAKLAKLTSVQTQQRKVLELLTQRFLEAEIESDTKLTQFYITEEPTLTDAEKLGKLPILMSLIVLITALIAAVVIMSDFLRGVLMTKHQLSRFHLPTYLGSVAFESGLRSRKAHAVVTEVGIGFRLAHTIKKYLSSRGSESTGCTVIAVTSKNARVGKTVTSLGIASAMHSRGVKTLVIDADYYAEDRSLRNNLSDGVHHVTSVSELLGNVVPICATGQKRQKLTVWSLCEEFKNADAIENLLIREFADIVARLRVIYDCVVIDCAPSFIPTMLLIYEQADINILCFAEGISTLDDVTHVTEIVEPASREGSKIFSVLTMTHLKSNSIIPLSSDGTYYRTSRAA